MRNFELPKGHRVFITHVRRTFNDFEGIQHYEQRSIPADVELLAQGGMTLAEIYRINKKGKPVELVAEGFAHCSKRDNYSKRIGREIATGRALKELANDRS